MREFFFCLFCIINLFGNVFPKKIHILTQAEIDEIVDVTVISHDSKVLTPEELVSLYANITYAAYTSLECSDIDQDYSANISDRKEIFIKSVQQRRSFMNENHARLGDTSCVRRPLLPTAPVPDLLTQNKLQAANYIYLAYDQNDEILSRLRSMSREELFRVQNAMQELLTKFNSDAHFCKMMRCFEKIGKFKRVKRKSHWYNPFSWGRYDHAIENFANHVKECIDQVACEKNQEEAKLKTLAERKKGLRINEKTDGNDSRIAYSKFHRFDKKTNTC